ncbi:MAG: DUF47 family protein [Anaerolineales bacterium]|nr:DUF47 family protein [Anaerolineales bacterium]MCB8952449.1 DUF47 family protein [Ardenticatenales bacterium]
MDWLKRFLQPKRDTFVPLIIQQGEYAVASVEALQAYLRKPIPKKGEQAKMVEREADEVQRILIDNLLDTFVTPLDREDLFALSRALDNFVDYVYSTVEEMQIFQIEPSPALVQIAGLLMDMARELHLATLRLSDNPGVASEHARRAKKLENQVEAAYRVILADLFQEPDADENLMLILKTREVLRHLSNAADQGDRAADVIMDIHIKWS